ncbi:MAG: hypothetical protein ACTHJW_22975 [Streptosporangiaceae bacterium]
MAESGHDTPVLRAMETTGETHEPAPDRQPACGRGGHVGAGSTDKWLAIPWPVTDGDEQRKLMREMVLRALI